MFTTKNNLLYAGLNFGFRAFNSLIVFALLARVIGLTSFGLLSYLITIITSIAIISDFGYGLYIVKEVSANPESVNYSFLLNKIVLKILIFMVLLSFLAIYFFYKEGLNLPFWLVISFCSSAIFITFSNFFFHFFTQSINFI